MSSAMKEGGFGSKIAAPIVFGKSLITLQNLCHFSVLYGASPEIHGTLA